MCKPGGMPPTRAPLIMSPHFQSTTSSSQVHHSVAHVALDTLVEDRLAAIRKVRAPIWYLHGYSLRPLLIAGL